jgi:hypothetical protein
MAVYRPDIPPHVAEVIRHLVPDVKRSVKQALREVVKWLVEIFLSDSCLNSSRCRL